MSELKPLDMMLRRVMLIAIGDDSALTCENVLVATKIVFLI
jgi:hypothetical protein